MPGEVLENHRFAWILAQNLQTERLINSCEEHPKRREFTLIDCFACGELVREIQT